MLRRHIVARGGDALDDFLNGYKPIRLQDACHVAIAGAYQPFHGRRSTYPLLFSIILMRAEVG
jgi:hypothetical protein